MNIKSIASHITVFMRGIKPGMASSEEIHILLDEKTTKKLKKALSQTVIPRAQETKNKLGIESEDDRREKHMVTMIFEIILDGFPEEGGDEIESDSSND